MDMAARHQEQQLFFSTGRRQGEGVDAIDGLGLRPARTVGVDLVWHSYVQSVLKDSIPSSAFDLDATAASGLLGHELDAAVTIRAGRFDIDLAAGVFLAGPGLTDRPGVAFFWRPQVRLYF